MKKLILIAMLLFSFGCTSAGPYVTNISSDGAGGLIIEKCGTDMNAFTGAVSTGGCTSHKIFIGTQSGTKTKRGNNGG
jgi:type IV secretion system protein VirB7